jgi:predicted O-linked N-acetylglucosamine transferase (SPINDLY family)
MSDLRRPGETTKTEEQFRRASAAFQTGNLADAERLYKKVLRAQPNHLGALNLLAILLMRLGRDEEAERTIRAALEINPRSEATQYNHGLVLKKLNRLPEALTAFGKALALNPGVADTWNGRGTVLNELERFEEALPDFDRAIAIKSDFVDAFYNRGNALQGLKRYEAAIESYDRAIALNPRNAAAYNNRGTALTNLNRFAEALDAFNRAVAIKPDSAESYIASGDILRRLGRGEEAIAAYDKALRVNPQSVEAWVGRGSVCYDLMRFDEALPAYDRAIVIRPDLAAAWLIRGTLLSAMGRPEDALVAYDKAVEIDPELKFAAGMRLSCKMALANMTGFDEECARLLATIRAGKLASVPLNLLSIPSSAEDQLICARSFVEDLAVGEEEQWRSHRSTHDRIRVGYLSSDMRNHPVGLLIVGLFERHDKSDFEIIALSTGHDDKSPTRQRMERAFDAYHDLYGRSDQQVAEFICDLEVDILVDLNGHTLGARPKVLARRPAPIQVNYLGYPGTIGAPFIDYIIADRTVIPADQRRFYSENVVYLPDTYQANDDKREIAEVVPSLAQAGLPGDGFVFCSFNNSYKINPSIFDVWMRLLREVDGSVLWLAAENASAMANLRREAQARGVSSDRLIFALRTQHYADHLARLRLADLFLDTLPYNAHTSASDALWAGLPVVTCLGATFAGRVAGSLLRAIGLPELVAHSLEEYEALALKLARDADLLATVNAKLAANRRRAPLFDTARFARHIEAAYKIMWERHRRGEPPDAFAVEPICS